MLLSVALRKYDQLMVVPFHDLQIPVKKKGPSYQVDFLIKHKGDVAGGQANDDENVDKPPNITTILNKDQVVMVIEIKQAVAANFLYIESCDVLELIIYCSYMMRLNNLNDVLGTYDNLLLQFNELSDFRHHH